MNLNWLKPPFRAARTAVPETEKTQSGYGFIQMETQGAARWTRREQSALIRESYLKNPVAYRAVRLVAEAVADVPWTLTDDGGDVATHPLLDLLKNPNPRQDRRTFLEALTTNLLLTGNAYVEQAGLPAIARAGLFLSVENHPDSTALGARTDLPVRIIERRLDVEAPYVKVEVGLSGLGAGQRFAKRIRAAWVYPDITGDNFLLRAMRVRLKELKVTDDGDPFRPWAGPGGWAAAVAYV